LVWQIQKVRLTRLCEKPEAARAGGVDTAPGAVRPGGLRAVFTGGPGGLSTIFIGGFRGLHAIFTGNLGSLYTIFTGSLEGLYTVFTGSLGGPIYYTY
jgi:hypothetical protein